MPQIHPSKYYPDRKDIRLKGYDYSTRGIYFVTIVTQGREELFGEVTNGNLISNAAGCMVSGVVEAMNAKYESHAIFTNYVVMPNHFHGIISIYNDNEISFSRLMQHFKSETTWKYSIGVRENRWKAYNGKLWQSRYYDHIIRCQSAYDMINEYISVNPLRWDKDKLNACCGSEPDNINALLIQYEGASCVGK